MISEEEKQRFRAGIQCPFCFGERIHQRFFGRKASLSFFQCVACGSQWHASDFPVDRPTIFDAIKTRGRRNAICQDMPFRWICT
jgi:Zn ribbon nucleic-acid-binding protein